MPPSRAGGGVGAATQTESSVPRRRHIASAAQSALVVQSCCEPIGHLVSHFDVTPPPRAAGSAQQTSPLAQLFEPEQAKTWPLHAAAVVHVWPAAAPPPPPTQHTCVAESHDFAPHAI
jgi:hypothetical protein